MTFAPKELIKCSRISRIFIDKSVDGSAHTCDFSVLSVPINGIARSHAVALSPGYIKMPGKLLLGKRYVREVRLTNGVGNRRDIITLPPRENVALTLSFVPPEVESPDLKDYQLRGILTFNHRNGADQPFDVLADYWHPELYAEDVVGHATSVMDFGEVHVAAPRTLRLTLVNPTRVDAEWFVEQLEADYSPLGPKESAPSALPFVVSPAHGVIPGKARSIPHKVTVDVTLRTSEARRYLTKLRFRVRAGRGCAVACAGMGSFDETVEAGYNSQHGHVHGMLDNYTPNDDVAL